MRLRSRRWAAALCLPIALWLAGCHLQPRLAVTPPSRPWARRRPSSITGSAPAAATTRLALVAMSVEKLTTASIGVSRSWATATKSADR